MSITQIEIQLIAAITAAACAIPGVFLVLQRKAMLSDAISHTVLLGIVLGFFWVKDLASPVLIAGAALIGVVTVSLIALLECTQLVREDAAIGLVFPALFSVAVILISLYAGNVHLDTDAVLVGEIAFAPFNRFAPFGVDIGPVGLYLMGGIFLLNLIFVLLLYKELKISSFDAALAASLGFVPAILHYVLMSLVSVTVVGAFDIVGSVLVVALMIAPPAAAYLLTDRLSRMLLLSVLFGVVSAVAGYWIARMLDASIAGSMSVAAGVVFALAFCFAPERGLVAGYRRRRDQRWQFALTMLTAHLLNHEHTLEEQAESQVSHLGEHMRWTNDFSTQVVQIAEHKGLIVRNGNMLYLTDAGRMRADQAFTL